MRSALILHLLGIVSFYSSHGSMAHLKALLEMACREEVPEVYIHAMLGRRGERFFCSDHFAFQVWAKKDDIVDFHFF